MNGAMTMAGYYGIFPKAARAAIIRPLVAGMKKAGITYDERMQFKTEKAAIAHLNKAKFDLFRDKLTVDEYGYL